MKKIIVIFLLIMTALGCSLFDPELWERTEQRRKENGRTCYRDYNGTFYCVDKYGNEIY